MTQSNQYEYFNRHCTEGEVQRNHQEIEQAIDDVAGNKPAKEIQKIWRRFIKE